MTLFGVVAFFDPYFYQQLKDKKMQLSAKRGKYGWSLEFKAPSLYGLLQSQKYGSTFLLVLFIRSIMIFVKRNPFQRNAPLLYSLKTSVNLWISDVLRGYRNGTLG